MATLADELLNDFEDSGDENEEQQQDELAADDGAPSQPEPNPSAVRFPTDDVGMELDGDEEEVEDDEELMNGATKSDGRDAPEDEEETKTRVEKMQLGGVSDVRSVAGLMKTLEPVLEVSIPAPNLSLPVYIRKDTALTKRFHRKSPITKVSRPTSKPRTLAPSKTIRNTSF